MRKSDYKKKYKDLVRTKKLAEAEKLLDDYRVDKVWGSGKKVTKKSPKKEVSLPKKKSKKKEIDDLVKIKGIGRKTIEDLKRIYNSIDELIDALKKDKVPLRDDQVIKLKKYLEV
ncbi:MAG: hypothetical protein ACTSWZ_01620 [Candidatus Heimdallarchaeaceae archaeon]